MLNEQAATAIVMKAFPKDQISRPISYKGLFVFQVISSDPDEGGWDPFFSVNQDTGELKEFSVITDGDINVITNLFLKLDKD